MVFFFLKFLITKIEIFFFISKFQKLHFFQSIYLDKFVNKILKENLLICFYFTYVNCDFQCVAHYKLP